MGVSNRMGIQWAIAEYVSDAAAKSIELDVTTAARKLSTKYPQSGFTLDQICRMIEELAQGEHRFSAGVIPIRPKPSGATGG